MTPSKEKKTKTVKQALRDALDDRGYETLTPVQLAVMAPELDGRDLLVSAQTGSGKTLGFGLAIAPTIMQEDERFEAAGAPLALVIAPTRELALQVKRELSWLYAKAGGHVTSCVGGMDMRDERRALARGAHIVVATPGRLRDHITRGSMDLTQLRAVVLDEADEMLDLGFRDDLEFILGEAPEDRQTLLFSATVPKSILGLAKNYQKNAERVITKSEQTQHADIEYRAMVVSDRDTENAVINTLRFYESPNAIVFGNTRAIVNRLTTRLSNRGFKVVALSGELSQTERTHALQAMRDGRARVCVATDVAARGIDLPNLDLVVHAELPNNHETMLHRSGRTGRAGRKGVSALIVTKKNRKKADRILHMAKVNAEWANAPSADDVNLRDEERMFADSSWNDAIAENEMIGVEKLTSSFTPEQVAAAYLRLFRSMRSAPEELSAVDAKPAPRVEFGESVWFSISGGRNADAEPRRLLPMLCKAGDITKDDIGAIRIQQDQSYVQIRKPSVAAFLAAIGSDMTLEAGTVLSELSEAPNLSGGGKFAGKPSGKFGGKPSGKPRPKSGGYEKRSENRSEMRDAPYEGKPKSHKPKSTPPVDWDDAPEPRAKKPKGDKPKYKSKAAPAAYDSDGGHGPAKRLGDGKKPRDKTGPKGPPPPKGKSNSKKNKARAAAAGKPAGKGKGGPKRG